MKYHTTTLIWLSLEDYYNKGLDPEKAKEIIENMIDPIGQLGTTNLRCSPMGLNRNWIVETFANDDRDIEFVVRMIESQLKIAMVNAD